MIVGINGFGRIGKQIYRILIKNGIRVALVNDPAIDIETFYYQAKYDSIYGTLDDIEMQTNSIVSQGITTVLSSERNPADIKWKEYRVDYVVECSGVFKTLEKCKEHDSPCIILSCPSVDIPMFVYGVNHEDITDERIISAASCTTNCLAPLAKLMDDRFGIVEGFVSTIHSMTSSQNTVDGKGKNLRSSRGCMNIIPTTTGAAFATEKILPGIKGKISAMAYRVPLSNVSLVDFVVKVKTPTSLDEIRKIIEDCNIKNPDCVLGVTDEELVSCDLVGDSRSSILDLKASAELSPTFFKLVSWYDNEYGYCCRVVDIICYLEDRRMSRLNKESS